MRVRSPAELVYRVRQEARNIRLLLFPPRPALEAVSPLAALPDPVATAAALRNTPFAQEVYDLAERIVAGNLPVPGGLTLREQPVRWRRDPLSGVETGLGYFRRIPYLDTATAGDHKLIWEPNRHQHLVLLCQAFRIHNRSDYLHQVWRQCESWLEQNPFQRGVNWASALEVAFRALSWSWILHLAGSELPPGLRGEFLTALYQHARHLEANLSLYFSPNTHLLGEAVALHALGVFFPRFPGAARWAALGARLVAQQIERQVLPDGAHFEQSSYYHVYALDMLLFHYCLAGRPPWMRPTLLRMAAHLDSLLGHARSDPHIGDDDGGRFFHPFGERSAFGRATLATCNALFDSPKWSCQQADFWPQAAWWLGPQALNSRPPVRSTQPGTTLYRNCGLAFLRSASLEVIVTFGSFLTPRAAHRHSDALSLIVRTAEVDVLADSGTFTYTGQPAWRNWFRSSAAHNTIRVDSRDQAAPDGPFGWRGKPEVTLRHFSSSAELDYFDASWATGGLCHRRRVAFFKPGLVFVFDDVDGGGTREIEQFWHPAPPLRPVGPHCYNIGGVARLVLEPGWELHLEEGGRHGWRSPVYGVKEPSPVIVARTLALLPVSRATVIELGSAELQPCLEVFRSSGRVEVRWSGERQVAVSLSETGPPVYEFDASS